MKERLLKILSWLLITPLALVVVLMTVVYLPPVQDFAVRKATAYASEATGLQISVERLRLTWLLDIDLQGMQALDEHGDTLLVARHVVADVEPGFQVEKVVLLGAVVHSKDLIEGVRIDGSIKKFCVRGAEVVNVPLEDSGEEKLQMVLPYVCLQKGDVTVEVLPTEEEDTTESTTKLCFEVEKLRIDNTHFALKMPADTLALDVYIGEFIAKKSIVDLLENHYKASLSLKETKVKMTTGELTLDVPTINSFHTQGELWIDSTKLQLSVNDIALKLPHSKMTGNVFVGDTLYADITSDWGREDVLQAAKPWLTPMVEKIFSRPSLHIDAAVGGSMLHDAYLRRLRVSFPSWLTLTIKGEVHHLVDSISDLQGHFLLVNERDKGQMLGTARVHLDKRPEAKNGGVDYNVTFATEHLHIGHILHEDSIGYLTMQAEAEGQGKDFQSMLTQLTTKLHVEELEWKDFCFNDISLEAQWRKCNGTFAFNIYHPDISAEMHLSTRLSPNRKQMEFEHMLGDICVNHLNLQRFNILPEDSITASMTIRAEATGGIKSLNVEGDLADVMLLQPDTALVLQPMHLTTIFSQDTTQLAIQTGDFDMALNGRGSYAKILKEMGNFADLLKQQIGERRLDENELKKRLPDVKLSINSGTNNNFYKFLKANGLEYNDVKFRMHVHPETGIRGGGYVYGTRTTAVQLDTLYLRIGQDSVGVKLDARACNSKKNPQYTFDIRFHSQLLPTGVKFDLQYLDEKGRKGVDVGANVDVRNDGFYVHLEPLNPTLAYRSFHLNSNNYLMLRKDQHIYADLDMLADDGTGFKLYSTPNEEALQDLSFSFNHFNLGELTSVLPYLPRITGFLHGDAHLVQTPEHVSVATELEVDNLTYEGAPLGQIGLQAVYLPNSDGSHFVDGSVMQTGMPMANFSGLYIPTEEDGELQVDVDLERLPLTLINGFLPEDLLELQGYMLGDLHVKGTLSNPDINGVLMNREMTINSNLYSLNLKVEDDTIGIQNGMIDLSKLTINKHKGSPLIVDGNVDVSNLTDIGLNIRMKAKDYELINAKKTSKAVAYGKAYVDVDARMYGTLNNFYLNGKLNVLGKSKLTYVLKDSPLTVEDELADLVTFVDFNDTVQVEELPETTTQNMHMNFQVAIEPTTQVNCILSADGASYVKLEGGGNLTLTSAPDKEMELVGRYTINDGTLKYTMMIIPLKSFVIQNGSYVEFTGPLLNPKLNLIATERVRVSVTQNEQARNVNFDVGLEITQTLQKLGLNFKLEAPDDATMQNELATMTPEQRSKSALTLLATGMYVSDTGTASSGTSALNAFLQAQINNVTGKVLKDVDLSLGVDLGKDASGNVNTDYSFRFAKRFWGNRISVIIGGSVSTGNNANETTKLGKSLIDNVSVEYRLDKSATRYVNVFYNKNYESVLDGEIIEMGGGLVLRKKSERLGDLFVFKKEKKKEKEKKEALKIQKSEAEKQAIQKLEMEEKMLQMETKEEKEVKT